jgi:hypothetical protein
MPYAMLSSAREQFVTAQGMLWDRELIAGVPSPEATGFKHARRCSTD